MVYQKNIIIDGESFNSNVSSSYEELELDYVVLEQENVKINDKDGHYLVDSLSNGKLTLLLSNSIKGKTLVIKFNINNIFPFKLKYLKGIIFNS